MYTVSPIPYAYNVRGREEQQGVGGGGASDFSLPPKDKVVQLHCTTSLNFGWSDSTPLVQIFPCSHPTSYTVESCCIYRLYPVEIYGCIIRGGRVWSLRVLYIHVYKNYFLYKKVQLNLLSQCYTKGR
jgi:hypothetical protein